jgi:hypothetical protein
MLILIAESFAHAVGTGAGAPAGGRIGVTRPLGPAELPAISVGVQIDRQPGLRWDADPAGGAVAGALPIEVWAASPTAARDIAQALEARIRAQRSALREQGFSLLRPVSLEPVEELRYGGASTSAFPVCRQTLTYAFAFQAPPVEEVIDGGPIRQIDVTFRPPADESLTVT